MTGERRTPLNVVEVKGMDKGLVAVDPNRESASFNRR